FTWRYRFLAKRSSSRQPHSLRRFWSKRVLDCARCKVAIGEFFCSLALPPLFAAVFLDAACAFLAALWMVATARDLSYMHLGCIFALFAAILAVLCRRTAAGFAPALIGFPLVCHRNQPPFNVHRDSS